WLERLQADDPRAAGALWERFAQRMLVAADGAVPPARPAAGGPGAYDASRRPRPRQGAQPFPAQPAPARRWGRLAKPCTEAGTTRLVATALTAKPEAGTEQAQAGQRVRPGALARSLFPVRGTSLAGLGRQRARLGLG